MLGGKKGHFTSSDPRLGCILIKLSGDYKEEREGQAGRRGGCCSSAGAWAPLRFSAELLIGMLPSALGLEEVKGASCCPEQLRRSWWQLGSRAPPAGLAAKTFLGFTPPCSFSCKHPGLVHRQLGACRRGWVCTWKVISLSLHPPPLH